jgi:hypothetical protein
VIATVDLDQLAQTRPPMPRLMRPAIPLRTGDPQPGVDHPSPQRLARDVEPVLLGELLARQRRPEVRVATSHEVQGPVTKDRGQLPVTRTAAFLRDKSGRSVHPECTAQSLDLTHAQVQSLGRLPLRQATLDNTTDDLQPVELFGTHRQVSRFPHVGLQDREGA